MKRAAIEASDHRTDGATAESLPRKRQRVGESSHRCSSAHQRMRAYNTDRPDKMPACPQVRHHIKRDSRASVRLGSPQLGEERLETLCHESERHTFGGFIPCWDRD